MAISFNSPSAVTGFSRNFAPMLVISSFSTGSSKPENTMIRMSRIFSEQRKLAVYFEDGRLARVNGDVASSGPTR